ncbi:hypothetical protein TRFO_32461 [Tritrichomonas foetus]|uniref:Uncharacterized protein n=1 Tax=Tritrichomonas foetus TaxID=1144522 RepID=A0A1J4JQP9_9EUKA|nr:hypothetical protein TRFO_32461 [Tritrichomonas foetus]|eukprot:OHT00736.1 hypothetical protein TRFO_32461 [Tritrichomonas foetus]
MMNYVNYISSITSNIASNITNNIASSITSTIPSNIIPKEKVQPELQQVVDGMNSVCESRAVRAKAQQSLVDDTIQLIKSETPRFEKTIAFSLDAFGKIAEVEKELSESEKRCKDDFNDIIERYKVIRRIEIQQSEAVAAVEAAKTKLKEAIILYENESTNRSFGTRLKNAEDAVQKAKVARNNAINQAKILTIQLIEEKKKFSHFKLNRFRHGCKTYASAVVEAAKKEAELYKQVANNFSEARKQIDSICQQNIIDASSVV